jgi:hypothetical protein
MTTLRSAPEFRFISRRLLLGCKPDRSHFVRPRDALGPTLINIDQLRTYCAEKQNFRLYFWRVSGNLTPLQIAALPKAVSFKSVRGRMSKTGQAIGFCNGAVWHSLNAIKCAHGQLHLLTSRRMSPAALATQIELCDLLLIEISDIHRNLARDLQEMRRPAGNGQLGARTIA